MTERTVIKNNWVGALNDSISEALATACGYFIIGGVIVTGAGAFYGYTQAPQGEDVSPYVSHYAIQANVQTWDAVKFGVVSLIDTIESQRPIAE